MAQAEIYSDQLQWQKQTSPGRLNLVPGFTPRYCEICSKSNTLVWGNFPSVLGGQFH
jgi:hypothetical protein